MKKYVPTAAGLLFLLAFAGLPGQRAYAQDRPERAEKPADKAEKPHKVAVLDLGYILQNYGKMKDFNDELKAEEEQFKRDVQAQSEKLADVVKLMGELKTGSPDYVKKENEAAKLKSNIDSFQLLKKRDIQRKMVQVQMVVHQEVQDAVTKVADHYGYTVVMRCIRTEGDTVAPTQIGAVLQQPVVWHRKRDDVTDAVLEMLNRRYEKSNGAAVTPASGTRPAGKKPAAKQAAGE
ncbi:MAG: OmpH family outer membrane protein [Planctomycetota bacterium]|nr:OmpH family outer membrane protein [Planctomycetota bacterium]